jgi:hypothetical protein
MNRASRVLTLFSNLGLMTDSLRVLANVSQSLQANGVTTHRAYRVVTRTIRALDVIKDHNTHIQQAEDAVKQHSYQSVVIDRSTDARGQRQSAIDRRRFCRVLSTTCEHGCTRQLHQRLSSTLLPPAQTSVSLNH